MKAQRSDLYVGIFVLLAIAGVVGALLATSGWGTKHFDLYILTDNTTGIAIDTRIYLQGLEVGRVVAISPRQGGKPGRLEFVVRARMVQQFADGAQLHVSRGAQAEIETPIVGNPRLLLAVRDTVTTGALEPGDTIPMFRQTTAVEAFGELARDLKGSIQEALTATTSALRSIERLADSLGAAAGTARGFIAGIRPGTEQVLAELAADLERVRRLLDSVDTRSGVTMREVDLTLAQSRRLLASADSLTRLVTALGAENRPEMRRILINLRLLSEQMLYVTEQLSRRPTRALSGIQIPDSLTASGRALRAEQDSLLRALRADSVRRAAQDTVRRAAPDSVKREPRP